MQEELQQVLKQNLKDIHLPPEVGLWPLAPAWWVLLVLILGTLVVTIHKFRQYRAKNRYRNTAAKLLNQSYLEWQDQDNTSQYLHTANSLLRRCVLHATNNADQTPLNGKQNSSIGATGKAWIGILNSYSKQKLSNKTQSALTVESYQKNPDIDVKAVHQELAAWINNHKALKVGQSNDQVPTKRSNV